MNKAPGLSYVTYSVIRSMGHPVIHITYMYIMYICMYFQNLGYTSGPPANSPAAKTCTTCTATRHRADANAKRSIRWSWIRSRDAANVSRLLIRPKSEPTVVLLLQRNDWGNSATTENRVHTLTNTRHASKSTTTPSVSAKPGTIPFPLRSLRNGRSALKVRKWHETKRIISSCVFLAVCKFLIWATNCDIAVVR